MENTFLLLGSVFTNPSPSTRHGADSRRILLCYLATRFPQRTQLLLLCVGWNVYIESLPSSRWIRHSMLIVAVSIICKCMLMWSVVSRSGRCSRLVSHYMVFTDHQAECARISKVNIEFLELFSYRDNQRVSHSRLFISSIKLCLPNLLTKQTPFSTVTVSQLLKKFFVLYWATMFINVFTKAR
jgi:hypothetical protein